MFIHTGATQLSPPEVAISMKHRFMSFSPVSETTLNVQNLTSLQSCKLHFFAIGGYNVSLTSSLPLWINTSPCTPSVMKDSDEFFTAGISERERRSFEIMKDRPVVQVDFAKLLTIYYQPGLASDWDVFPLRSFPSQWTEFDTCDVYFGIEHTCRDKGCLEGGNFARYTQLQNWMMASARLKSPTLRKIIDAIMDQAETQVKEHGSINHLGVQDVCGSGIISDVIRNEITISTAGKMTDYWEPVNASDDEIGRFNFNGDRVCIGGLKYSGTYCGGGSCLVNHRFEGSWKGDRLWRKEKS